MAFPVWYARIATPITNSFMSTTIPVKTAQPMGDNLPELEDTLRCLVLLSRIQAENQSALLKRTLRCIDFIQRLKGAAMDEPEEGNGSSIVPLPSAE